MKTLQVNGFIPADQLVFAGDGVTLIANTDINNTLYISKEGGLIANEPFHSVPIGPQSTLVVDGKEDVFGITQSGIVITVLIIDGGVSYFQSGITGAGFQANKNGAFFYEGQPGPGNLIEAITGSNASGQDEWGNQYTPGGTDLFSPAKLLVYAANPPALHNLAAALAGANGADGVGNNWAPGVTTYGRNTGAPVGLSMQTGSPHETENGYIAVAVVNLGGASEQPYIQIISPQWAGASDFVQTVLNGPKYNSPTSSQGQLLYSDTGGTEHTEAVWGQGGFYIELCNGIFAVAPGTGDTTLIQETWHTVPLASGWSTVGGQPAPKYRLLPDGNVQHVGCAQYSSSVTTATQLSSIGALPAAYRPTSNEIIIPPCLPSYGTSPDMAVMINSAGTLIAYPPAAGSTLARYNGLMPLGV